MERRARVTVQNRQRRVRLNLSWIRRAAGLGLERCREIASGGLTDFEEITVAVVSDAMIADLHLRFMGIAGPTDVLTFQHGEIVLSAETAQSCAQRRGEPVEMEITLYTVHGFLHLNGFDDRTPLDAARMRRLQSRILRWCRSQLPPP